MNRVEEILEIIFSLPMEEREEVERRIKERKKEIRGRKRWEMILFPYEVEREA